jgi:hypothetical protein
MSTDSPLWAPPQALLADAYGVAEASRLDPLVDADADFDRAQITIVYVRHLDGKDRTLFLGAVELLTPWTESGPEVPRERYDQTACLRPSGSRAEINVRRVVLPASESLAWYRSCLEDSVVLPATGEERGREAPRLVLTGGSLAAEPPWPCLVVGRYDDQSVNLPLVGHRPGGVRTHHALSLSPPALPAEWNERDREEVRSWLRGWLHWDLLERPALFGSVHLIATNPLFRELHVRLAGAAREDVVFLRVDPLPGRSIATLVATVEDIRPYGPALSCAVPLTSRSTEIRLGHEPHMLKIDVYCSRRGLLLSHGPFAFIRAVSLNAGLVSGERIVKVPEREGRPTTYKVSTTRFERKSVVGSTRPADARTVAAQDVDDVLRARAAESTGQQVFMRDVGEAESALRRIIGEAHESVRIVDPYLGPTELLVFGLANGNLGVHVDILTSAQFLRDSAPTTATSLATTFDQLQGRPLVNPIELRVARGRRSPIHDRFLVVDGRVWLLGSSLSELGSRGTVVVQLRDPAPVVALLQKVWDEESDPIHVFLERRASASSDP